MATTVNPLTAGVTPASLLAQNDRLMITFRAIVKERDQLRQVARAALENCERLARDVSDTNERLVQLQAKVLEGLFPFPSPVRLTRSPVSSMTG